MEEKELISACIDKCKALLDSRELDDIVKACAEEFRRIIDTETMIDVRFEYSPYDDTQGDAFDTKQKYNINNYPLVSDFLENYTGEKEATFQSHRGWNWLTFEHDLSEFLRDFIFEFVREDCEKILGGEWIDHDTDDIDEYLIDVQGQLENRIHSMKSVDLYNLGVA